MIAYALLSLHLIAICCNAVTTEKWNKDLNLIKAKKNERETQDVNVVFNVDLPQNKRDFFACKL